MTTSRDDHGLPEATPPVLTVEGAVATVRLNRPRHLNRIEPEDLTALDGILVGLADEPAIRVLVLTGTGRVFCSGYHLGDIGARQEGGSEREAGPDRVAFEAVADRLEDLAVPTICRLNGGVYGGATDLALACDFRVGIDTAELVMPAARLGLHYYPSGLQRFVSRIGADATKRLFLTAQGIPAAEMLRIGYLTDLVPPDALDARVAALAATLAGNAPRAVAGMKRTINAIARGSLDRDAASARHRESMTGEEIKEGLRAFREKRAPVFTP